MRILVRISVSTDNDVTCYPLFMVNGFGLNDKGLQAVIDHNVIEYIGYSADSVFVDVDGVCWHNGGCLYADGTKPISEEDAQHLERILGLSALP
ncbi:hypothetical protein WGQ82_28700 (plasmid) [Klebsiella pneumoniae]|jgi:hypothetical protein|uniref:hypothetical protein n=1 Tax=Klebsiella TaxID=570 RepID=UPI000968FC2B|nr:MULTISPECIES: hypothetical protein [Klebsiella]HDG7679717.1 hypothetical protein [Klebsiella quasipneumoniae]EIW8678072.1 hypothetical protein [Klebsiella pneumoniae]EIY2249801.1 hypothetical protein [Klebsiella pneumoniae]EKU0710727.1 hypothetical protein [Klebsiella pneumoniae]EKU7662713.1 hypothetical protein [Klebsiella pneumoniae]